MQTSKVIEADGVFIGVAILMPPSADWRFVAADPRARAADGATAATFSEARLLARRAFILSRGVALGVA